MPINDNSKAKAPEKSSFTRRCSLLSRYLKEKGSFGNIDLALVLKPESDLRLPGNSDPPGDQNVMQKTENSEIKAMEFFQRVSKAEPSTSSGGILKVKDTDLSNSELTIFFGGQVLVFNEFPADKAKEIMQVAKQAITEINTQTQTNVQNNNTNMVLPDLNEPTNSTDINQQQQEQHNQVVERIARRASLHRFFAKRKDRAVARAPYQVNQNAGHRQHCPPKPETVAGQPLEQGQSSQRRHNVIHETVTHPKQEGDKDMSMEVEEEGQSSRDLELKL